MKPKPVQRRDRPAYPTQDEMLAEPDVFVKHQPRAWRLGKGFAGAVAMFVAANVGGCSGSNEPAPPRPPEPIVEEAGEWIRAIYDDGTGGPRRCVVMGVMALASPFPPEDEAVQIVSEEN